jgi:hypothetical protein
LAAPGQFELVQRLEGRLKHPLVLIATIHRALIGHRRVAQISSQLPSLLCQLDARGALVALGGNAINVVSISKLLQIVGNVGPNIMPTIQKLSDRELGVADRQQNHRLCRPNIIDAQLGQLRPNQACKPSTCTLHEASKLEIRNLLEVAKLSILRMPKVRLCCLPSVISNPRSSLSTGQTEHTMFFHSTLRIRKTTSKIEVLFKYAHCTQ